MTTLHPLILLLDLQEAIKNGEYSSALHHDHLPVAPFGAFFIIDKNQEILSECPVPTTNVFVPFAA